MTTAARPTYHAAVGKQEYGGFRGRAVCAKDQAAHTKLKFRQLGQHSESELKNKDFRSDLDQKQRSYEQQSKQPLSRIMQEERQVDVTLLLKNQPDIDPEVLKKYDDGDVNEGESDADFDSSSEEDDEDDEDDDEQELQAELQRIRAEREQAQAKRDREDRLLQERVTKDAAVKGNPLAYIEQNSAKIKRRWNDDVVFRNQARDEPEHKKRFINDTIRSDFHRSFLKKFIH